MAKTAGRLLAVDIGNSEIDLGVFEGERLLHHFRLTTPSAMTEDEVELYLRTLLRDQAKPDAAIVGSVVPSLVPPFLKGLKRLSARPPLHFRYTPDLGVRVAYPDPTKLGADRLANALFVAAHVRRNAIVVDVGTAVTVDAVDKEGNFLGGAILPGPELAFRSLHRGTAQLPLVEESPEPPLPGTSTEGCIRTGVIWGTVFAIRGLRQAMAEALGWEEAFWLLTGGGARVLQPYLSFHLYDPLATLKGLREGFLRLSEKAGK